jgi:hypothetical protein
VRQWWQQHQHQHQQRQQHQQLQQKQQKQQKQYLIPQQRPHARWQHLLHLVARVRLVPWQPVHQQHIQHMLLQGQVTAKER